MKLNVKRMLKTACPVLATSALFLTPVLTIACSKKSSAVVDSTGGKFNLSSNFDKNRVTVNIETTATGNTSETDRRINVNALASRFIAVNEAVWTDPDHDKFINEIAFALNDWSPIAVKPIVKAPIEPLLMKDALVKGFAFYVAAFVSLISADQTVAKYFNLAPVQ